MDLGQLINGGRGLPTLEHNSVHVWRVNTAVAMSDLQVLEAHLAPDERLRAERFYFDRDRRRFTVCRGCLRLFAAAYSGRNPVDVRFRYGPQGKPELLDVPERLQFSVSHSGEVALLALAIDRSVGVDVEMKRADLDFAGLAASFFSKAEHAAVLALPPECRAGLFFEYWTCKEACIKADGGGLSIALDQFSVIASQDVPWREAIATGVTSLPPGLRIHVLDLGESYSAAVAATGADWGVQQRDLD